MGSAFYQLCLRYSGTLTPTAYTAVMLWETFSFFTLQEIDSKVMTLSAFIKWWRNSDIYPLILIIFHFAETFATNPQYRVTVTDPDDDDDEDKCTILVGLLQKDRRKKRKEGLDMLTIGYVIYKV